MSDELISAIAFRQGVVSWTTLRQKKNKLEIAEQREAALVFPPNVTDLSAPEVTAQLKSVCAGVKGRLCVSVPTDQVLLRVAQLPSVDPAELKEMAALQVDKFCPFPIDHMSVALEIFTQKDGSSRVLIAAVQRDHVEKLGATFRAAGLAPREVDIDILGWWYLLVDQRETVTQGRHVTLIIDEQSTELIVTQDGTPLVLRTLGSHKHLSPTESAEEIADEINYTLTSMEAEWGAADVSLKVWHWNASPGDFLARLQELCALPTQTRHLEALPPLSEGLARRSVTRGSQTMNLAPPEWTSTLQSQQLRKNLLVTVSGVFFVWLLGVSLFGFGYHREKTKLMQVKVAADELKIKADEVRELIKQVDSLKQYGDRSRSGLECFREICVLLSEGIELTSFTYTKYGDVLLRGEAESSDPIYDFMKKLEQSELFEKIEPGAVTSKGSGGKQKSQFSVKAVLPGEPS